MKISVEQIAVTKAYGEKDYRRRLSIALLVSVVFHLVAGLLIWRFSVGVLGSAVTVGTQAALDIRLVTEESSGSADPSREIVSVPESIPAESLMTAADESTAGQKPKALENNTKERDSSVSAVRSVKRQSIVENTPSLFPKYYYSADELERRPKPLFPVVPVYPSNALAIAGRVTLLVFIDERGIVDDFRVLLSEPKDVFDKESIQAFSKVRYVAGRMGGLPVKSQFLVDITFEPGSEPTVDVEPSTVR